MTFIGPFNIMVGSSIIMAILSDFIVIMAYYVGPGGVFAMRFLIGIMVVSIKSINNKNEPFIFLP